MAALGWLMSLAEKRGPGKSDEIVAAVRKAAEKTPADHPQSLGLVLCVRDAAGQRRRVRGRQGSQSGGADRHDGSVGLSVLASAGEGFRRVKIISCTSTRPREDDDAPPLDKDELAQLRRHRTRRSEPAGPSWPERRSWSRSTPS